MTLAWGAATAQPNYAHSSRLAEGKWFKIAISETGVYKISTNEIPALLGVNCDSISMFGNPGGQLSTSNMDNHPDDLNIVAIDVVDNNQNGIFDNNDYVLFYAEGPNVWRYSTTDERFEYNVHAYANNNYYFLTPNGDPQEVGQRLQQQSFTSDNPTVITSYTGVALYHPENTNTHGGGQIWVADKFTNSMTSRSYQLSLPSSAQNGVLLARFAFAHVSDYGGQMTFSCGSQNKQYQLTSTSSYQTHKESFNVTGTKDINLSLSYSPRESQAAGYLDYIELNAIVPLSYAGGQLFIRNNQQLLSGNVRQFVGSGDARNMAIIDVTNVAEQSYIALDEATSNGFRFYAPTDVARTFIAFSANDLLTPSDIKQIDNQNIHGSHTPNYVIVCNESFLQQANEIAQLHRDHDNMEVTVLTEEQVFNEYSSGMPDPVAVRQMMRSMRAKSDDNISPQYLLMFGKGTYDNRNILNAKQKTVITWQTPTSFDTEGSAYPSDDVFGYLSDSISGVFERKMSVSIGRLPAKSQIEATHMVDKIRGYMERRDFESDDIRGDWRNYVTLLADDADPSCPGDTNFASDSEKTARLIKEQYPYMNIDRIYADAYIQQSGADGSYYPDVNNALRQRMNYGTLLFNYIGHGSASYIGTERYMGFSDIEKYTNIDRLALFVTSTCSFGHYDLIDDICGAEQLLLADGAGIGVVTASRPIHHIQRFNTNVCLFSLNPENTIGDALRQAKNITAVSHCINLLGDPALKLSIPKNKIVVTKINGNAVVDDVTDSCEVLSRVTIEGEIQGPDGSLLSNFDGTIYPIVFDREAQCQTLANDNDSTEIAFVQQKSVLYKGRENVTSGKFSYSFIIPRDVAYHYDLAKLSHYARSNNDDATGEYSNIMFGGFNEDLNIDPDIHPIVKLWIGDTNFRNGGITNETPTIYALLSDSIGINAAGSGLGHDITAVIDGNPYSTITLNDYFNPDIDDSRNGEIIYTLGKLDEGLHTLTLKCWNIFNNSGSAHISFYVKNDKTPVIGQFVSAPNPAHDFTEIRIEHNLPGMIKSATIDIYDIRGSHLRQVQLSDAMEANVLSWRWDFSSENGVLQSKGIYIARLHLVTSSGESLVETTKIVRN